MMVWSMVFCVTPTTLRLTGAWTTGGMKYIMYVIVIGEREKNEKNEKNDYFIIWVFVCFI